MSAKSEWAYQTTQHEQPGQRAG